MKTFIIGLILFTAAFGVSVLTKKEVGPQHSAVELKSYENQFAAAYTFKEYPENVITACSKKRIYKAFNQYEQFNVEVNPVPWKTASADKKEEIIKKAITICQSFK